ncbi:uncharacterized protein TA16575 [Theileria annulata]|uniref:Thrombospondin type 1 domain containing protein n=1 Tax=Theileria annulata TaxID=5874 RepID=Q4UIH7_THEAN|nr:uncharacterized protein TA16575 [Theileria annulata]CAI73112.1 hypothetical protein TA16575 [Theileria annulata]|eukprot:XP_953790.1 hypothetical protein TA16575 [Theileria annulata]
MDSDVLTYEAEKLKEFSRSKGLLLPNLEEIDPIVDIEDYNLSIIDITNKFEGIYTLIQDIRARKFKYDNLTNWNPFQFEYSHGCKPFFTKNIENFGYDPSTSNCKCPEKHFPCSLNQALSDISNWSNNILEQDIDKPVEELTIVIDGLKKIDIYGNSIKKGGELSVLNKPKEQDQLNLEDQFCKSSEVILCSSKVLGTQNTQWSDWSGCSSKCGHGTQERFKISYNGNNYKLLKESRACELSKCSNKYINDGVKCALKTTTTQKSKRFTKIGDQSDESYQIVKCECNEGERLCSSDEAYKSIDEWISTFRKYCDSELTKDPDSNILQGDIMGNKKEIFGKRLKIEFSDGFYFDCSENWGIGKPNDLHIYCKSGSPVLCTKETPIDYPECKIIALDIIKVVPVSFAEILPDLTGKNDYFGFILVGLVLIFCIILFKKFTRKHQK